MELAEIAGEVAGPDGVLDGSFNGEVDVVVFDAERRVTLPPGMAVSLPGGAYRQRTDLIYRGRASVQSGRFNLRFVVPRDISFSNEAGRISAYAASTSGRHGYGFSEDLLVGGTAQNPIEDFEGPRIRLFLNDTTFVSGSMVGSRPRLIVKLEDESGINTVGAGVGHELLLTINGDERSAVDLGPFYRGELDSYQRGRVDFQLGDQPPGGHRLRVRAWDVANNSSTAELEYFVQPDERLALRHVYNYPNPTPGRTQFVFEHNQPTGATGRVQIRIYTLSGRPIRTIDGDDALPGGVFASGMVRVPWDGRDEDFDVVSSGVYLYKVRVEVDRENGERQVSEHIERLAVIR
jgi:hypothetical protein